MDNKLDFYTKFFFYFSIPSLSDPLDRIELSIQSAHIALVALDFIHVSLCYFLIFWEYLI